MNTDFTVCLRSLLWCVVLVGQVQLVRSTEMSSNDCKRNVTGRYERILAHIFKHYDNQVSPNSNYETVTQVDVSLAVSSVHSVSEADMDYKMLLFVRQSWVDTRLRYDDVDEFASTERIFLNPQKKDKLWVPDVIITNEKESKLHKVMVPNEFVTIQRDGVVYTSTRVSVTASCFMDLVNYPHDIQECMLGLESFGYTTDDVMFHWNKDLPIDNLDKAKLNAFKLLGYRLDNCTGQSVIGNFTCISVYFSFERQIGFYMTHVFIPSILIVMLSWVSFWVDVGAVPARVSIALLTVLTLTTQSASVTSYMPKVSYIKAMDIWMATCLFFVVLGLLEYAWANVLARREAKMKERAQTEKGDGYLSRCSRSPCTAQKIDRISRVLFPVAFIIFNVLYWFVYELSETPGSFKFNHIFN